MTKSLGPFRFPLITVSGWMNNQQLQLIDYESIGAGAQKRCD
jgi:hypothetical protein